MSVKSGLFGIAANLCLPLVSVMRFGVATSVLSSISSIVRIGFDVSVTGTAGLAKALLMSQPKPTTPAIPPITATAFLFKLINYTKIVLLV